MPDDELLAKNISTIEEIKARGGPVIAVTDAALPPGLANDVIKIPRVQPELAPIVLSIPLQLSPATAFGRKSDCRQSVPKPRSGRSNLATHYGITRPVVDDLHPLVPEMNRAAVSGSFFCQARRSAFHMPSSRACSARPGRHRFGWRRRSYRLTTPNSLARSDERRPGIQHPDSPRGLLRLVLPAQPDETGQPGRAEGAARG
ncbi:hypothetical protein [Amycolatopsis sp. AA4]|uniref:hypothetical protein n=1 Tax=Amycolatopsis sp. AA4 TaxID=1896961 RepID=UPI003517F96D